MSANANIVIGRAANCDFQLSDTTVSGHHARLTWVGRRLVVEDLSSANGTFVNGERIQRAELRPGEDLRLGAASFPWGHPKLYGFLRRGAAGDTILGMSISTRKFICGACGHKGTIPKKFTGGNLACQACKTPLIVGRKPPPEAKARRGRGGGVVRGFVTLAALGIIAAGGLWLWQNGGRERLRVVQEQVHPLGPRPTSAEELSIRVHARDNIVDAMDVDNPVTRNAAARVAAEIEGPFSVEQVANVWSFVRKRWRYVNDPQGSEYFANASETIENEYVGDCDDFAIVVASMIRAVGGRTRIVMMNGPAGGHAYPEVCVDGEPEEVRSRLDQFYRRNRDRSLRARVRGIYFRPAEDCSLWLNLDWNAGVPGGPYEVETWAVAVYPDGVTETLATVAPPADAAGGAAPAEGATP